MSALNEWIPEHGQPSQGGIPVYPLAAPRSVKAVDHWKAERAIQHIPSTLTAMSDLLPDPKLRISFLKWRSLASARARAKNSPKIKQQQKIEQLDAALESALKGTSAGWGPFLEENNQETQEVETRRESSAERPARTFPQEN